MVNYDFHLKRNDLSPALKYQCQDEDNSPVDITQNNEVRFIMESLQGNIIVEDDTSGSVTVVDSSEGIVKYEWQEGDTEKAGIFKAEWEVEYSDGKPETFPNYGKLIILIEEDLG